MVMDWVLNKFGFASGSSCSILVAIARFSGSLLLSLQVESEASQARAYPSGAASVSALSCHILPLNFVQAQLFGLRL